jgi:hypothetical protein
MPTTTICALPNLTPISPTAKIPVEEGGVTYSAYVCCISGGGGGGIIVAGAGTDSSIRCGVDNTASGCFSAAIVGRCNTASGYADFVGGYFNSTSGSSDRSSILGGTNNTISNYDSSIIGGTLNSISGINSAIFEGLDADFAGLFNSNSSVQFPSKGDISIFSGGSFKKVLSKGDSAEFYIIFAADTLKNNVGQIIRNTINEIEYISSVNNDSNTIKYSDARYIDFVNLDNEISKFSNFYSVEIFNLQGERVLISLDSTHSIQDELAVCTSGIYQVIITDKKCNKVSVTMSCVK